MQKLSVVFPYPMSVKRQTSWDSWLGHGHYSMSVYSQVALDMQIAIIFMISFIIDSW